MNVFDFQPTFNKTVLKNGIRVVTEHHPYTRASSAAIYVKMGARDEPKPLKGSCHFIEHMVFKGTKNRNAFEIASELESVGGELNAYTTREYTCYHATSLREHLYLSLDVLSDLLLNATFNESDFKVEKDVIFQEIEMASEQFEEYIFDLYFERAYRGHSLGGSILGTKDSLSKISRKELHDYYKKICKPENLVIAIAGSVDHDEVTQYLNKKFSRKTNKEIAKPKRRKPEVSDFRLYVEKPTEQVHFLMGYPTASFKSDNRFEAYLASAILGGGMTSRLYQEVREKRGLVYSVYSYLHNFTDSGLLMLYGATSVDKYKEMVKVFQQEMGKIYKKGVTKSELDFFKKQVYGQIMLGADDIENRMNSIAVNEMVFKKYRPVEDVIREIESVTVSSIKDYFRNYLKLDQASAIILGDLNEDPKWSELI